MKIEINIRNGSGWNRYPALKHLTFPAGTRRGLRQNGVTRLVVEPHDSERPLGIAARFYTDNDAGTDLRFTLCFDRSDSAEWIRERVSALLTEGIDNRLAKRRKEIAREATIQKIKAWRHNWDDQRGYDSQRGANRLRARFGVLRKQHGCQVSRKRCWELTNAVRAGTMTYRDAIAQF